MTEPVRRSPFIPGKRARWALAGLVALLVAGMAPLMAGRNGKLAEALCTTQARRLGTAMLLYAQDHDGCVPPIEYPQPGGEWRTWTSLLTAYMTDSPFLKCPLSADTSARNPYAGFTYPCGYAINLRFHDYFGNGAFSLDALELPSQTAMLVEAGPVRSGGPFTGPDTDTALNWYWDTSWWPGAYGSPHSRRMVVAAADGHVVCERVAHYSPDGHDMVYGRLAGAIYNWNGGHLNGETDGPVHE